MLIDSKNIVLKNGVDVNLQSPRIEDVEILLTHFKNVFHESYRNLNLAKDHWDNFPIEEEKKILNDFANSKEKFLISAFYQNRIIGNIGCVGMGKKHVKHNAMIGMGIENEFQGFGLGKALLEYAILKAKEHGFTRIELNVRSFNKSGIALYESVGFRRVGILKNAAFIDDMYFDDFMYELVQYN